MASTYTQIVIHAIAVVSRREHLIRPLFQDELFRYISGTLRAFGAFPYAVGGWRDHVHMLFELPPAVPLSKMVGQTKAMSSKFINDKRWLKQKFNWQEGYAAFSCSKDHRLNAMRYIMNQEEHHRMVSFKEEYLSVLKDLDIVYDEKYLFVFVDEGGTDVWSGAAPVGRTVMAPFRANGI